MAKPAPRTKKPPAAKAPPKKTPKPRAKKTDADSSLLLATTAARTLEEQKCQDVTILDLRGLSPVADYFVIGSGSSDRQLRAAADHTIESAKSLKESLYRSNLDEKKPAWLVLDFVDVVVHVFMPDARRHYDLEMLWGDAPRIEWSKARAKPEAAAKRNRAGLKQSDILPGRSKSR